MVRGDGCVSLAPHGPAGADVHGRVDQARHVVLKVIGRLPGETSCTTLVWAVLDRSSRGARGFTMTPTGLRLLHDLRRSLLEPPHCNTPNNPAPTSPNLSESWPNIDPSERISTSTHYTAGETPPLQTVRRLSVTRA